MAEELAFSLDLLAQADTAPRPLTVCGAGHLVVNGNTHWAPRRYDFALRTLLHEMIPACDD